MRVEAAVHEAPAVEEHEQRRRPAVALHRPRRVETTRQPVDRQVADGADRLRAADDRACCSTATRPSGIGRVSAPGIRATRCRRSISWVSVASVCPSITTGRPASTRWTGSGSAIAARSEVASRRSLTLTRATYRPVGTVAYRVGATVTWRSPGGDRLPSCPSRSCPTLPRTRPPVRVCPTSRTRSTSPICPTQSWWPRSRSSTTASSTASCRGCGSTSASSSWPRTRPSPCSSAPASWPSSPATSTSSSWSAWPVSSAGSRPAWPCAPCRG